VLVAFNVWLDATGVEVARRVAAAVRGPQLRALGLAVGPRLQVSMNLVDPATLGPDAAYDHVAMLAEAADARVAGAELVGLLPADVLARVPRARWEELDLDEDRTIEARLARAGS
jgi:glutamate formiminotransferase